MTTEGEFNFSATLRLDFCTLLREVKTYSKPVDALLEDPEFQRKSFLICHGLTHNQALAEDLFQTVNLKVWLKFLEHFTPDYSQPYGNFFAWYRKIARRTRFSNLRKFDSLTGSDSVDDHLRIVDLKANAEEQLLRRELEERILNHVKSLPRDRRLIVMLFLKGRSSRRSAKILKRLQVKKCCHATFLKRVKEELKPFFPDGISSVKKAS